MKNSKTTLLGILTILAAVSNAAVCLIKGMPVDYASVAAAVTAGIGLINAKDGTI